MISLKRQHADECLEHSQRPLDLRGHFNSAVTLMASACPPLHALTQTALPPALTAPTAQTVGS